MLKEEFLPYMPVVMPIVLAAAALDPQLKFLEEGNGESEEDDEDLLDRAEGAQKFSLKTSMLEEKVRIWFCSRRCFNFSDSM